MNSANRRISKIICRMLVVIASSMLFISAANAAAKEYAGKVLITKGYVAAKETDNGKLRVLKRRSKFYQGEIIITGADSQAQLRFTDGAVMALKPESEIKIDSYKFKNGGGEGDKNFFTLIKGGFKTISGVIGKSDPAAYQARTSVATIGIRGTTYEAVLDTGALAVAAWRGSIVVENEGGALTLGSSGAYNFAVVSSNTMPPQGLLRPPAVLENSSPENEGGEVDQQSEQEQEEEQREDEQEEEPTEDRQSEEEPEQIDDSRQSDDEADNQEPQSEELPSDESAENEEPADKNESAADSEMPEQSDGAEPEPAENPQMPDDPDVTDPDAADVPDAVEVSESSDSPDMQAAPDVQINRGEVSDDGDIANVEMPLDIDIVDVDIPDISETPDLLDGTGGVGDGEILDDDSDLLDDVILDDDDVFDLTDINDPEDGVLDEGIAETEGSGETGSEGTEEGVEEGISEGVEEGVGEGVEEGVGEGVEEGVGEGVEEGVGEGAEEGALEGAEEGIGEGAAEEDLRISTEEKTELTKNGVIVLAGQNSQGVDHKKDRNPPLGILLGQSSGGALGPILYDKRVSPWEEVVLSETYLVRQADAQSEILTRNRWYDVVVNPLVVQWGRWNATESSPFRIYTNPTNLQEYTDITSPAYWLTGKRLEDTVVTNLSGSYRFDQVIALYGDSYGGAVTSADMFMDIDLSTGVISEGILDMFVEDSFDLWIVDFEGNIRSKDDYNQPGSILQLTVTGASLNNSSSVIGVISGLMYGNRDAIDYIGGGFRFQVDGDPSKYVGGVYLLGEGRLLSEIDKRLSGTQLYYLYEKPKFGFIVADSDTNYGLDNNDLNQAEHGIENMPLWRGGVSDWGGNGFAVAVSDYTDPRTTDYQNNDLNYIFDIEKYESQKATLIEGKVLPDGVDADWGMWQYQEGGGDDDVNVMTDKTNDMAGVSITNPLYWITASASSEPQINARTIASKKIWFSDQLMFDGTSNRGAITDLKLLFDIDFADMKIHDGRFVAEIDLGGDQYDYWDIAFSGTVAATSILDITIDKGVLHSGESEYNLIGTIDSIIAGESELVEGYTEQHLVDSDLVVLGDFRFEVEFNPTQYLSGIFINRGATPADYRLSAIEYEKLDDGGYLGIAAIAARSALYPQLEMIEGSIMPGGASIPDIYEGNTIIAAKIVGPQEPEWEGLSYSAILRKGEAIHDNLDYAEVTLPEGMEVIWGKWEASLANRATAQVDPDNGSDTIDIRDPVYWITARPTLLANMPTTGVVTYNNVIMSNGMTSDGAIGNFDMGMYIDFSTGAMDSGYMDITNDTATQSWYVGMSGQVSGNILDISNISGSVSDGANYYNVTGDIPAMFVGESANGVAGSFRLEADGAPSTWSTGIFVIGKQ